MRSGKRWLGFSFTADTLGHLRYSGLWGEYKAKSHRLAAPLLVPTIARLWRSGGAESHFDERCRELLAASADSFGTIETTRYSRSLSSISSARSSILSFTSRN